MILLVFYFSRMKQLQAIVFQVTLVDLALSSVWLQVIRKESIGNT